MDTCDHEYDHDSIVVYGKSGCGICSLLEELEDANNKIKKLEDELEELNY